MMPVKFRIQDIWAMNIVDDGGDVVEDSDELATWEPRSLADTYIEIRLLVQEVDELKLSWDLKRFWFDLLVATQEGLEAHHDTYKSQYLLIREWDWGQILCDIERRVADCEQESWDETMRCVRKRFFLPHTRVWGR